MVDVSRHSNEDRSPLQHPVLAGAVAVAVIAGLVAAVRTLAEPQTQSDMLWLAPGAILGLIVLKRIATLLFDRGTVGQPAHGDGHSPERGMRRHRRYVPVHRATSLYLQDGREIPARIANISVAAVAIEAQMTDLDFATVTRVGTREAGPVRRTANGAVFGFKSLLEPRPFDGSFVL